MPELTIIIAVLAGLALALGARYFGRDPRRAFYSGGAAAAVAFLLAVFFRRKIR